MKKALLTASMLVALSACNHIPAEASYNRGSPFSLLDTSSEVVNVALSSESSVQEAIQWVDQDQPTQAEVYCMESDPVCSQVLDAMDMYNVPVKYTASADNMLMLMYDRVVARDCENRYVDNPINPYNLNHPSLGCAMSVNIVQMVGDKRQFTSPALMDFRDGDKAVQDYETYMRPHDVAGMENGFQEDALGGSE